MKKVSTLTKVLTGVASAATLVLFVLFPLVTITAGENSVSLNGLQICFGSSQTVAGQTVGTYKSAYYILALIFMAFSTLAGVLSVFKKKAGWRYTSVVTSIAAAINICVLNCARTLTTYLDTRPLNKFGEIATQKEVMFTVVFILALATAALSVVMLLVSDYADVVESKGAKLTIIKRIKHFFKDYASELKKIVWPSKNVVVRNTIIVILMCAIVGGFIWALDYGFVAIFKKLLGINM